MNSIETGVFVQYKFDDGYEIVHAEKSDLVNYIVHNKKAYASMGGESIVGKGNAQSLQKNILEKYPTLFTEFAALGNNKENMINFVNNYGLLLPSEEFKFPGGIRHEEECYTPGEKISFWGQQIRLMHTALQVWQWCKNEDTEALKNVITQAGYLKYRFDFPDYTQEFRLHEWQLQDLDHALPFDQLLSNNVFLQAKLLVQQIINKQLHAFPIEPCLLFDKKSNLKQYFRPSSLLSLMWFQFFRYVTGEQKIKQCPVCNNWYDVSDDSDATRWNNRCPMCANRLRVQKTSVKKRYLSGMSADEILRRTKKTNPDTIKEWIQEWENEKNAK